MKVYTEPSPKEQPKWLAKREEEPRVKKEKKDDEGNPKQRNTKRILVPKKKYSSGQISVIPKPELRGFGEHFPYTIWGDQAL